MSEASPQLPDAPATGSAHASDGFACPNCGTASTGEFCPACGQKKIHPGDLSVGHAWHHVVHELVHVDGKLLHSLKLLFTRPGQLTLDFIEGRRARHMHPIQLFLSIGVVFFFLAHVNSPVSLRALVEAQAPPAQERLAHMAGKRGLSLDQFLDRTDERMSHSFKTIDTTAFLLQGLGLWLLFRKRRPYLAEHMVMTLHLACFSMVLGLATGLIQFAGVSRLLTSPAILAAGFIYFLLAARRFYGGSWLGLAGAWVVIQLLKMGVILLAFIGVISSVLG